MIFIFLDGVGVGKAVSYNPFYTTGAPFMPFFEGGMQLPDGTRIKAIDPLLGTPGIPQSATGQTSIYTGVNVPALLGEHKGSFPNKEMRRLIKRGNLLSYLKDQDASAIFLNAYPGHSTLFSNEHINILASGELRFSKEFPRKYKKRISATTCMMVANGQRPFDLADILEKRAIYQDFSNRLLIEKDPAIPEFSPETAADILYERSKSVDFVLYEYFLTDLYGHRSSFKRGELMIADLNRFISRLISRMDAAEDTLMLSSDHGNLEDFTNRLHTKNPVPLLTWGKFGNRLSDQISDIAGITPAIVSLFKSINAEKKNRDC